MQSRATTVEQYLSALPEDRRRAIAAVRQVILENLDQDYEEGMQYGMIGYYVPHTLYPAGYHCDPRQPLPFASLASQKNHMAIYMMCQYASTDQQKWFADAWKKTGKKLDMGKSCIRFNKLDDLALDVIGEAIRRVPAKKFIAIWTAVREAAAKGKGGKASKKSGKPANVRKKSPKKSRKKS
jgi:hypothetical protein